MPQELAAYIDQIKEAKGQEQIKLFITYCHHLIKLKEEGKLSEEDVGYNIVNLIRYDNLSDSLICTPIFDVATTLEIPRSTSYNQPIGEWNEKTANLLKQREWEDFVGVMRDVKL